MSKLRMSYCIFDRLESAIEYQSKSQRELEMLRLDLCKLLSKKECRWTDQNELYKRLTSLEQKLSELLPDKMGGVGIEPGEEDYVIGWNDCRGQFISRIKNLK